MCALWTEITTAQNLFNSISRIFFVGTTQHIQFDDTHFPFSNLDMHSLSPEEWIFGENTEPATLTLHPKLAKYEDRSDTFRPKEGFPNRQ
eukprot:TRINITY_DN12900_c0_g1_i1.p1 TRINITY_DN12900_c0_g1~~TRINITY_DN12900_c0_g1_i1.p1  ORF type:complete len:90 (+),score=13.33 TRINITY_DN12900_c0_g1_i1:67-336(+)